MTRPGKLVALPLSAALLTAALVTAALVTAGCGTQEAPSQAGPAPAGTPATSSTATPTDPAASASAVPRRLAFQATTVDGAVFSGATLAGRPAVLWFWAPWCTICRAESGDVARAAKRLDGRVAFVGVSGRDQVTAMKDFVADTGVGSFPHLADVDGTLWSSFGVTAQPAFAFVRPDGRIEVVGGGLSEDDLVARAESLAG